MKGYDSHFIFQKNAEQESEKQPSIDVIANNSEKYMTFTLGQHLVFLDSFQFMNRGLASSAKNLPKDKFIYTKECFSSDDDILFQLMCKKGVYPYDYMDSFEKFDEKKLPRKEDFYSLLNDKHITNEEYQHAINVWNTFNIKNLGEYHDLYLKSDILLLADVFENFRYACLENFNLDPCHYCTTPGMAWDAMLKMTGVQLELITDIDQQLLIEKGMRGGISYIANRHLKANNKYLEDYKPELESSYLIYLDANNLYGWAMIQPLPYGGFKWVKPDNKPFQK
ncbi:MAG: hypothetical protein MJB14_06770 [Spirochaetes bacterium]|nr:hypothetical protein [Spirochaetota bacterium]